MGLATHLTGRGMEAQCALPELESCGRHDDERRERPPAGSLAIPAVTVQHHHRFGSAFVANRAASASAGEGCGYFAHIYLFADPQPQVADDGDAVSGQ